MQDMVANKVLTAYSVTDRKGRQWMKYYQTNSDALKAFQQRKIGGMGLSRKVWNYSQQYKQELELACP
ncbi:MAG: hypothetical protein ACLR8Y_02075 [Alistipes indistinctus]